MQRTLIGETPKLIGQTVKLAGWVNVRRDQGKLIFIDLRDRSGEIQLIIIPDNEEAFKVAKEARSEFVIEVEGLVKNRPGGAAKEGVATGGVEIEVEKMTILNKSKNPPFEITEDTSKIHEDLRLRYRYLDLRSDRMKNNLLMRGKIIKFIRDFYTENGFVEVETPILTKGTPEGSREFIVPSRLHNGKFYVLPQSPQQFKQLLMVAGIEKYFQIAKCFRDEDQRGDRQPEFTQLDVEVSFPEGAEIRDVYEKCLIELIKKYFPEKKIAQIPFPGIDYEDAMREYGSDKPDLRVDKNDPNELAFCWVLNFPLFVKDANGNRTASHHPFTAPIDEDANLLNNDPDKVRAKAYDIVLNGNEIGGGSIRIHKRDLQQKIFEILGLAEKDIGDRFGHILEAFEYGAPPHGGIASGLDRLISVLMNESNIREIMAFPKTGEAEDLLMGAPSELDEKSLKEAGIIKIVKIRSKLSKR